jgi:two-component system, sensor histidine kinase LadS
MRNDRLLFKLVSLASTACLLFFMSLQTVHAAGPVKISKSFEDVLVPPTAIQGIEDPEGKLSFTDINTLEFQKKISAVPYGTQTLKPGTYYWLKFSILNESDKEANWILQLPLHSENLLVYIVRPDGSYNAYHTGQQLDFQTRSIDLRTLAFELPPDRTAPVDVYIHLLYKEHSELTFIAINEKSYLETHTKGYLFIGLIYGILFLMAVYNLILYFSIKERTYIYYVLYILSATFFISRKDGLAFQFLWPHFPALNTYHHSLSLFLLLTTFLLYTNSFIDIKNSHPKIYLVNTIILLINFFYFVFTLIYPSYSSPLPMVSICSFIYFLGITIYYLNKNYKPARYLVVGLSGMVMALLILKLMYLNVLEWNWFIEYVYQYAIVIDSIAMSLAMRDKLIYLKEKKEQAEYVKLEEEKLKTAHELIQLKNLKLESEVTHQNNQLAAFATNSVQKMEFLNRLKKELEDIYKEVPENMALKKLIKNIDKESDFDNHWEQFQLNFDKAHHNFLARLKESYPNLKPGDLMLCAYTKLGKSNKEIGTLLNITISGVEKKRLRLKEKMNVVPELSLSDFLVQLK